MSRLKTGEDAPVLPVPFAMELLPEQILVDEELNVRPYTDPADPEEIKLIQELADTILKDGQIHPVLVRLVPSDNGDEYHLVAGRRRRAAIELINAGLGKEDEPKKVQARVESNVSVDRARKQALSENIHRRSLSPMDLAYNIKNLRDQFGDGRSGSKKIADYLGISIAQV